MKQKNGNINVASTINEVYVQSPVKKKMLKKSSKYLKCLEMSNGKALCLFFSAKTTKIFYIVVRNSTKVEDLKDYPIYNKI